MDINAYFEHPGTNCATWLDYLRSQPEYLGEDEDYIFFKASVVCQDPYTLAPDPDGTRYYTCSIHAIETYIEDKCPDY